MPAALVFGFFPNRTPDALFSANTTAWQLLASDGTGYSSLALLLAVGKVCWPGLDKGMNIGALSLETRAADAAGSPFYYYINPPTAWQAAPLAGGGEWVPGGAILVENPGSIYQLWVQKTVGTDVLVPIYRY